MNDKVTKPKGGAWTPERLKKFRRTMAAKKKERLAAKKATVEKTATKDAAWQPDKPSNVRVRAVVSGPDVDIVVVKFLLSRALDLLEQRDG